MPVPAGDLLFDNRIDIRVFEFGRERRGERFEEIALREASPSADIASLRTPSFERAVDNSLFNRARAPGSSTTISAEFWSISFWICLISSAMSAAFGMAL